MNFDEELDNVEEMLKNFEKNLKNETFSSRDYKEKNSIAVCEK